MAEVRLDPWRPDRRSARRGLCLPARHPSTPDRRTLIPANLGPDPPSAPQPTTRPPLTSSLCSQQPFGSAPFGLATLSEPPHTRAITWFSDLFADLWPLLARARCWLAAGRQTSLREDSMRGTAAELPRRQAFMLRAQGTGVNNAQGYPTAPRGVRGAKARGR